jgi:hypothetical protein
MYASYSVTWLVLTVNNTGGDVNLESLFLMNGHRDGITVLSTTSLSSEVF